MRTIDKIITKVSTKYGAPMGRYNVGSFPATVVNGRNGKIFKSHNPNSRHRIYDCKVPLSSDGAYDKGGAYWGLGKELRVRYNKELSFVQFYRVGDIYEQ